MTASRCGRPRCGTGRGACRGYPVARRGSRPDTCGWPRRRAGSGNRGYSTPSSRDLERRGPSGGGASLPVAGAGEASRCGSGPRSALGGVLVGHASDSTGLRASQSALWPSPATKALAGNGEERGRRSPAGLASRGVPYFRLSPFSSSSAPRVSSQRELPTSVALCKGLGGNGLPPFTTGKGATACPLSLERVLWRNSCG
jgi:hypothetical protein